jgi:8-oxo-dGTP pyrophosphatase MutT (NUDIX family)
MLISRTKQRRVRLLGKTKTGVRTQFGALCWRVRKDKVEVLLVQTRRRKRWIIPKGWPMEGTTPAQAAATEAYEEAGIEGIVAPMCVGLYSYTKYPKSGEDPMPCMVAVFPLKAKKTLKTYPEKGQRKRKWVSIKKAAKMSAEPELAQILLHFDPTTFSKTAFRK